ncbi:MAG: hypothetical protein AB7V26_10190 [Lysobacterales bacterium]
MSAPLLRGLPPTYGLGAPSTSSACSGMVDALRLSTLLPDSRKKIPVASGAALGETAGIGKGMRLRGKR